MTGAGLLLTLVNRQMPPPIAASTSTAATIAMIRRDLRPPPVSKTSGPCLTGQLPAAPSGGNSDPAHGAESWPCPPKASGV